MDFHVAVPGPFTYLVHEHARSIIAIQELQQEVTSLLEFRDHVLEALPHLHHHHHHSLTPAPTHDLPPPPRPAPPPTTRAEASPSKVAEGGRHPHHHQQQQHQQQQQQRTAISSAGGGGGGGGGNSSSSSTGGGKSLSETHSSSAVADSGFSTDKAGGSMGKSSSSSAGEHLSGADDPRWTSVEPEAPLGSAEDELWQLLDVIQRKGTRLRHELERAERAERERLCAGGTGHAAPASDPLLAGPRPPPPPPLRDYWPHSLPGPTAADLLPPPPPPPLGMALEAEAWAAVERLRQDRQYLVGRVGWAEAEAAASHQRLVDLHGQLLALAGDRRRLEDQVRALRPGAAPPATPAMPGGGASTVTITADPGAAPSATITTTTSRARRSAPSVTVSVAGQEPPDEGAGRTARGLRSATSVRLNADRERDVVLPRVLKVPIKDRTPRPAAPAPPQDEEAAPTPAGAGAGAGGRRGSDRVVIERERRPGRADGGLSMPVSLLKGTRLRVAPNKQRISAILREKDVLELQRQLLTTVMEAEVLRKQIESAGEEWAAKTAEWEADHRQALASVTSLKEENTRLRQQLEEGATATVAAAPPPVAKVIEKRDIGISACPVTSSTGTLTGEDEEEATHTVHHGPNVKYDVVVHQESTPGQNGTTGRRNGAGALVEKPPRRSRDPRTLNSTSNSTTTSSTPPLRETAESPVGRDSLGRGTGLRGRHGTAHSSRGTPTGTPRSSPAPSITPRICTTRSNTQETPRGSPLTRSSSGTAGRVAITRRDSLKAAQAKGAAVGAGKGPAGGAGGGGGGAAGQQKVAPPRSADQGSVCQPRPMREAPRTHPSPRSSPHLTLADLRTPSPSPASSPAPASRPGPARKLGTRTRLLPHKEAGSGAGAGRALSPGTRRGAGHSTQSVASPQELRLSHLAPVSPSPSPPASCSSYYDSINSEGPPQSPGLAQDRLMQVEVAFEWSPVSPARERRHPEAWSRSSPSPAPWPRPISPNPESPRQWPPDSLEGAGSTVGFEASGRVRNQLAAMNGAARGRAERGRLAGRPRSALSASPRAGLAQRAEQDLNSRVHQILARIASGGH